MKTVPTPEWLTAYEQKKELLVAPTNFNHYFSASEICNRKLFHLNIGEVNFPTGNVLVRDPLVYLKSNEQPYFHFSSHWKISFDCFGDGSGRASLPLCGFSRKTF